MNPIIWDEEHTVQLIREYQQQNVLWNPENRAHQHRNARNDAWMQIASAMHTDVRDIKRKMNSLIAVFRAQHRKGVSNPRWWASHMTFLLNIGKTELDNAPQPKLECTSQTYVYSENSPSPASDEPDGNDCEFIETTPSSKRHFQSAFQEFRAEFEPELLPQTPPTKRSRLEVELNASSNDSNPSETIDPQSSKNNETPSHIVGVGKGEDLEFFVKYLASKMQTYSARTRNCIQFQINRLLYEADIGQL